MRPAEVMPSRFSSPIQMTVRTILLLLNPFYVDPTRTVVLATGDAFAEERLRTIPQVENVMRQESQFTLQGRRSSAGSAPNWFLPDLPAKPPCGGVAGSSARAHRRSDRPLDTPSSAFRNRSSSTTPAEFC